MIDKSKAKIRRFGGIPEGFGTIWLEFGIKAWINRNNDKIDRQAVITQGKNEGWVVFSIALVAKWAVKYAYPAQKNKRQSDAIRLRFRILFIFNFSIYYYNKPNQVVRHFYL